MTEELNRRGDSLAAFFRFASETGVAIISLLQSATAGDYPRPWVVSGLDSDGVIKVWKELPLEDHEVEVYRAIGGHPSVPALHGVEDLGGGMRFLRLQYCHGISLADLLPTEDHLSLPDSCRILARLAAALAYLHARGVLYLDLRPENIKIDGQDVWLLDMGDSRVLPAGQLEILTPMQDPRFAPVEVITGKPACSASDVYELGALAERIFPQVRARPAIGDLIKRMLSYECSDRPTAEEARGILWREVEAIIGPLPLTRRVLSGTPETPVSLTRKKVPFKHGAILFPARMGVPHRGHVAFMSRLLEHQYKLVVSIQHAYKIDERNPLPKWIVAKMIAQSLRTLGHDLDDVRFMLTPYFATDQQHRLHFACMPNFEELETVASGNPAVHKLFEGMLSTVEQRAVFGKEGEEYESRSWGAKLREAVTSGDQVAFNELAAPGTTSVWTFEEIRSACLSATETPVPYTWGAHDWGKVFAVLRDASGNVISRSRVGQYSSPEDTLLEKLGGRWMDRYARESSFQLSAEAPAQQLSYLGTEIDIDKNLLVSYRMESA